MKNSQTSLQPRSNFWLLVEKIIALLLLLWAAFILYALFAMLTSTIKTGYLQKTNSGYGAILLNYHLPLIMGILCLFGGWMMFVRDKTGWMLCVISSFIYGLTLLISSRSKAIDNTLPMAKYFKSYGVTSLIFFAIFILLILKPIRKNYQPTLKMWGIIGGAILIFVLDRMFVNR